MAGTATVYTEQAVLGHSLGFATMVKPASVFVGLTTSAPTADTPGNEVVGGAYTRQSGGFALTASTAPISAANAATIAWAAATGRLGHCRLVRDLGRADRRQPALLGPTGGPGRWGDADHPVDTGR